MLHSGWGEWCAGYEFEHFRAGSESIWKSLGLKGDKWNLNSAYAMDWLHDCRK